MLLVFGSFNADYVWRTAELPAPGETCLGEFASAPGGKGFNQAMAAHRLGAATVFAGALGADAGAALARAVAAADGLACRILDTAAPTGTACVVVDRAGRNQIVVAPGANLAPGPADLDFAATEFARAKVLLVQLENAVPTVLAALQRARAVGALTILNPAPAPDRLVPGLLAAADVLTPNETEFSALLAATGHHGPPAAALAALADAELHDWSRRLGAATVVITLGAQGAFVSHGSERRGDERDHYRVAAPVVTARDSTGAGDCFNGALAAALLADPGLPFRQRVQRACQAAALSVERVGAALAMPTATEYAARFPAQSA